MIDPHELETLYGDFISEAEFEFDDEAKCFEWCNINCHFLRWLAKENKYRERAAKGGAGSFEHFRRLMSAEVC